MEDCLVITLSSTHHDIVFDFRSYTWPQESQVFIEFSTVQGLSERAISELLENHLLELRDPSTLSPEEKSRGRARSSWTRYVETSHILAFPVYETHLTESIIHWKCEGLETTFRFLIWANGDAVHRDREPQGRSRWGVQFWTHGTSVWVKLANARRLGVHERGLDEDHPYLDAIQITWVAHQSQSSISLCLRQLSNIRIVRHCFLLEILAPGFTSVSVLGRQGAFSVLSTAVFPAVGTGAWHMTGAHKLFLEC